MLLVPDTIRLLPQVLALKTILAANAIFQKPAIAAVAHARAEEITITMLAVRHLVRQFNFIARMQITTIFASHRVIAMENIFRLEQNDERKIIIPAVVRAIAVLGILGIHIDKPKCRCFMQQFVELPEEWPGKIEIAARALEIPVIRPKAVRTIRFVWRFRRIRRHSFFLAQIARTTVNHAFVTPIDALSLAA